jgi:uncharacterized membrane protein
MIEKILSFLKKYHRLIIWTILGFVFILDIITTTVGLQNGGYETNPVMKPFVGSMLQHSIIKIVAFVFVIIMVEYAIKYLKRRDEEKKSPLHDFYYKIFYILLIFALLYLILFYSITVFKNMIIIGY